MQNMLVMPREGEEFGEPDFIIYNAGCFPCNRYTKGMSSSTSVCMHFRRKEMVICFSLRLLVLSFLSSSASPLLSLLFACPNSLTFSKKNGDPGHGVRR